MDEAALIKVLRGHFESASPEVLVGIGDDAAVLAAGGGSLVLSVDAAVEHVHFERRFASLSAIGHRSFSAALSDLAAMGAEPRAALVSLVLPPNGQALVDELARGLGACASLHGCPIVGGNLSRGSEIAIHTTVVGSVEGTPLTRSGARVGDELWVTGTLGGAALGLVALTRGITEGASAPFVARWRGPVPRIETGRALRGIATAALDLSDGLLRDAARLAEASGVCVEIDVEHLPRMAGHDELSRSLSRSAEDALLAGGEDYELLFTAAPEHHRAMRAHGTLIGRVALGSGVLISRGGVSSPASARGYDHFG